MTTEKPFEIFLEAPPGLEDVLLAEVSHRGFKRPRATPGGVVLLGGWSDVWRANLWIRGAGRVLARLDAFRATDLLQLAGRARHVPWASVLRPDVPFRVAATCRHSRLYHSGAVEQRIAAAIHERVGAPYDPEAEVTLHARIENDHCTISVNSSGKSLHKRGHKQEVNAAPMRETMAALFLRQCGFTGEEPLLDPMCGSGTLVIEAAEIAARLNPGRARHFAFEHLATFDAEAWDRMRAVNPARTPPFPCHGSDRDAGAIAMSLANAERAGLAAHTRFQRATISEITPPEGPPGLVLINPPYGARLGGTKPLMPLYQSLGQALLRRFAGWRVGLVAADPMLARATGLPFLAPGPPVPHGGLRVTLFRTGTLN